MPEPLHCPICHEVGKHADRCPGREPEKAPEPKESKLEREVGQWAKDIADRIPKPQVDAWRPKVPMQAPDGGMLYGPDGKPVGMKSEVAVEKTGAEQLWAIKRQREPCEFCANWSQEQFEDKDRSELATFLAREAHWDEQAIKLVVEDVRDFGVCQAFSEAEGKLHVSHKRASCLHLFQPKAKGWLKSFAGKIFGGSSRHGM